MGRVPNFTKNIFPTANMPIFSTFAEVGLVFFMNLVGLELNFGIMSTEWKSTALISAVGIALPMGVSVGSSYAVWDSIDKHFPSTKKKTFGTYVLFMCVPLFLILLDIIRQD
jgi:Kef-type K+ transport system membrane component KefB